MAWRADFEASFRRRNAACESFRAVVAAQQLLARQNAALRQQKESAEKQLLILQHEHVGSGAGPSAVVRQLEAKVRSLQEELLAKAAGEAASADTKYRLLAAETGLGDATRALEALRGGHAEVKAEAARLAGSEAVLRKEVESLRTMLRAKEEECAKLRLENSDLVMRKLEVLASMQDAMNNMNESIERLSAQNAEFKAAEDRRLRAGSRSHDDPGLSGGLDGAGVGREAVGRGWSLSDVCPRPEKLRFTTKAHHTEVNCVCYSMTEPLLFTGSSDGFVKVWEAVSGAGKATLRGAEGAVMALDSSDGTLAGAADRNVKIWDLKTERLRSTITGHSNKVHSVRFGPDGRTLVTGSTDRTIKVFDSVSGREARSMKTSSSCNALDLSADGATLVSAHLDGTVRLWDVGSGSQLAEVAAHGGQATSCAFSPRGGMTILTAGRDAKLCLLDARTLETTITISHPALRIGYNWSRAAFSPDGAYCVCGSTTGGSGGGGAVLVWDLAQRAGGGSSGSPRGGQAGAHRPPSKDSPKDAGVTAGASSAGCGGGAGGQAAAPEGGGWGLGGWGLRAGAKAALGGALESTLGSTRLGNAVGNTIGGGIGARLAPGSASVERAPDAAAAAGGSARGVKLLSQLKSHGGAVTSVAWAPGVGGWHQVASVDKDGHLCLWD